MDGEKKLFPSAAGGKRKVRREVAPRARPAFPPHRRAFVRWLALAIFPPMNLGNVLWVLGVCATTLIGTTAADAPKPAAAKMYRNPLLPEIELADPHVIRGAGKYYLYATTHTRGYDVYVSDDLVHWENKGGAFDDPRRGVWAPDVFHNKRGDGKFYLYYTDNMADAPHSGLNKQIGVAVADSPLGPFKDKAVLATNAIDAHLFQDDDGKFYLYYVDLAGGFKIRVQPMADPLTKRGNTTVVIRPTEPWEMVSGHVTEGPFMLKRNGVFHLMFSGTGADSPNYGIGYATAKSPLGPFTKFAGNPIAHRGGKVLGPGHHCVVEGPDQKLWLVYHQKWTDEKSFHRFLAIDPLWFDEKGVMHAKTTRETDEPAP
jgi:xylan 1,4-beta-xylosidase